MTGDTVELSVVSPSSLLPMFNDTNVIRQKPLGFVSPFLLVRVSCYSELKLRNIGVSRHVASEGSLHQICTRISWGSISNQTNGASDDDQATMGSSGPCEKFYKGGRRAHMLLLHRPKSQASYIPLLFWLSFDQHTLLIYPSQAGIKS